MVVQHLGELGIRLRREGLVRFEGRTERLERNHGKVLHEHDRVGVAHRDARRFQRRGRDHQLLVQGIARAGHRDLPALQDRGAHVDARTDHRARTVALDRDPLHAVARIDAELVARPQPPVGDMLRQTPDAVAAHLGNFAVRVVVVHEEVGVARAHDADQAVGADPEVAVAHRGDERRVRSQRVVEILEQHEVVPRSVRLHELHPQPFIRSL